MQWSATLINLQCSNTVLRKIGGLLKPLRMKTRIFQTTSLQICIYSGINFFLTWNMCLTVEHTITHATALPNKCIFWTVHRKNLIIILFYCHKWWQNIAAGYTKFQKFWRFLRHNTKRKEFKRIRLYRLGFAIRKYGLPALRRIKF